MGGGDSRELRIGVQEESNPRTLLKTKGYGTLRERGQRRSVIRQNAIQSNHPGAPNIAARTYMTPWTENLYIIAVYSRLSNTFLRYDAPSNHAMENGCGNPCGRDINGNRCASPGSGSASKSNGRFGAAFAVHGATVFFARFGRRKPSAEDLRRRKCHVSQTDTPGSSRLSPSREDGAHQRYSRAPRHHRKRRIRS